MADDYRWGRPDYEAPLFAGQLVTLKDVKDNGGWRPSGNPTGPGSRPNNTMGTVEDSSPEGD